jgi:hypothetical protein
MFVQLSALVQHRKELDALEAAWHDELAEYHRSEEWRAESYGSAAAALGDACRMDPGVAHAHVNLARKLVKIPLVAHAFRAGDISARHATVVANGFTSARAAQLSNLEEIIVDVARAQTPKVLAGVVGRVTDAIDGDGGAESEEERYKRRRYHGSRSVDDMLNVNALYDPESADIHEKAIDAEVERDQRAGDDRTMSQRRADAVTNLFRQSLNLGLVGTSRAAVPHVTYIVHLDGHTTEEQALINLMRTERQQHGRLSARTLERLQCDCDITRIVTTGVSEILDVGRATRTVSAAQWKALVARDQHCQGKGCNQPPERCQAHHVTPFAPPHYGRTDIDNLKLFCWYCHREEHKYDAQPRAA